ncbi:Cleavage stimulation factor 50K chain [Giardia muris]|uniref:Cleavage stimulation factor 50 kDa subunit n=1 Tax=Giardia muris TaxID=5742 RepID=A0A4Z1SYW8_GIAMU|nr:Cleavage stimulation factor 50K chain [Giardia muris]|eukprot:TNJ29955.1 Cleavage stimulation factor 50K chain [Giardia muris]
MNKAYLYQLIVRQLRADGFYIAASQLQRATATPEPHLPPNAPQLAKLLSGALESNAITDPASLELEAAEAAITTAHSTHPQNYAFTMDPKNYRHQKPIVVCRFSPDGKYLATGARDACLKLISVEGAPNTRDGPKPRTFYGHHGTVADVAFHPYAQLIATCSEDTTIRLFSMDRDVTGSGHLDAISMEKNLSAVAWHPSGTHLVTGTASDTVLRIFDLQRKDAIYVTDAVDKANSISMVGFNSNDRSVKYMWATHQCGITFYDRSNGRRANMSVTLPSIRKNVRAHFLGDGSSFLLSDGHDACRLYDIRNTAKHVKAFQSLVSSATTMDNDQVVIGLTGRDTAEQKMRVIGYLLGSGERLSLDKTARYNNELCCGNPVSPMYALVYDKTLYIYRQASNRL